MKYLLLVLVVFSYGTTFSQKKLDKKINHANTFYKTGDKQKAVDLWKKAESQADNTSANYGKALRNLLFYYSQGIDEHSLINYYSKIMNFKLNAFDSNEDIGESFLNAKYHSTMLMASFYKKRMAYSKALHYIEMADESIVFNTRSITNFSDNKIDLAMWKYWLYIDFDKRDLALSKLIKRAFEYEYKAMYKSWNMESGHKKEKELAQMIYGIIEEDVDSYIKEIDQAIANLTYDKQTKVIKLRIKGIDYEIVTYKDLNTATSKQHLKESIFYQYINVQNRMATNE